ncbi:MAG: SRPBCC family protein [Terracidiphilus sp.]
MTSASVTLSVQIARPATEAFRFIADPATMPQWAIHNVKAIRPVGQNEWEIQTPRGAGRLIPRYNSAFGILDHDFVDPREGSWEVSARIVPAGTKDSIYMITLVKPPSMPDEAFNQGMPLVEEELQTMKRILARRE